MSGRTRTIFSVWSLAILVAIGIATPVNAVTITVAPGIVTTIPNALQGFVFDVTGANGDNRLDDIGIAGDRKSVV